MSGERPEPRAASTVRTPDEPVRPFARSGMLIAMIAGAVLGVVLARAVDMAAGGGDPDFAAGIGGAFGGVLGRSLWSRRAESRRPGGRPFALSVGLLLGRVVACGIVGLALVGALALGGRRVAFGTVERGAMLVVGLALLVATGLLEHRRAVRARDAMRVAEVRHGA